MCTGPAPTCSNTLRRHVAATNPFVCVGEFLWRKSLSLQQSFVAATSRTNSVWFDFLRLVAATKLCCGDKDFHKNFPAHTTRFVAATCRCNVLLQLVAKCVPTKGGNFIYPMMHRFILYYQASERTWCYQFNRDVTVEQQWKATCFADKTFCTFAVSIYLRFSFYYSKYISC